MTFAKLSALGLSGAVHAAVFLTPLGHPAAAGARGEGVMVDVQVQPEPEPVPEPAPPPPATLEDRAPAYAVHTHPHPVPAGVPARHECTRHDPSRVHAMAHVPLPAPEADTEDLLAARGPTPAPVFSMVVSAGAPGAGGVARDGSLLAAEASARHDGDAEPLPERSVDTPARIVRRVTPSYPAEARAEDVEARVELELVVSASGDVERVRVEHPAGHGLDAAAVDAARRFVFAPAIKGGRPVPVTMVWVVDFRLD